MTNTPEMADRQQIAFLEQVDQLYTMAQIDHALGKMAQRIETDYCSHSSDSPPLLIGVMNGAIVTLGHLLPKLNFLLDVDYCHATRYGESTCGSTLHWLAYPQKPLRGRDILLVDDIFDEGVTLEQISQYCVSQGAKTVKTAVLLNKKHPRKVNHFTVDYVSLDVDDRYVFGFGLDYKGLHRNAAGIFAIP